MTTPAIMLQGTGSDVGKSLLAAGLARAFTRAGLRVRPFKPQNMSNNAAVVAGGGGEIGRAQALQARACGLAPTADMNPVLIKPESDTGAQIVVHGKVAGRAGARDFRDFKAKLLPAVLESFARLSRGADLVVVEGAGSSAEVNLRAGDIANMGFAVPAAVPVLLVGDVDRGGVIASLIGTHALLDPAERALLKGSIVNKLRGDPTLFDGALRAIEEGMGLPCLGVVPFLPAAARLPAEDAVGVRSAGDWGAGSIRIAVPMLARIANFDDLDPLAAEPDVALRMVPPGAPLPGDADLVILPGTKATLADLAFLRAQGWDIDILAHHRRGGAVLGICGGYQMLGTRIADPDGIEGPPGEAEGLGLLDVATRITGDKRLTAAIGTDTASGERVQGYEIHMGETDGPDAARPMLALNGAPDGAVSRDGRVTGCYLHGLFAGDGFRHAFLARIRPRARGMAQWEATVEDALDALATHLEAHLDLDRILAIARAREAIARWRSPSPGR